MTLKGADGRDAVDVLTAGIEDAGKEVTRDATSHWQTTSEQRLMEAAGGRSEQDAARDMRGALEGRRRNQLHEITQSFTPVVWDDNEDAWQWAVAHEKASLHEWGAQPHEIRAVEAQALVFEWPDMPPRIREKFQADWDSPDNILKEDMVAFDSIDHPGVPAIGYMRYGRDRAREYLEGRGIGTTAFTGEVDVE